MKNTKQTLSAQFRKNSKNYKLAKTYEKLKKDDIKYFSFESMQNQANQLLKAIKRRDIIVSINSVSRSGMTRRFSFKSCRYGNLNLIINILYNNKFDCDNVRV